MSTADLTYYVPDFEIVIEGYNDKKVEIFQKFVQNLKVVEQFQSPAEFSFVLADKFDIIKQKFAWLDNDDLQPGKKDITIRIGYRLNGEKLTEILTKGKIKTIVTSGFSQSDAPTVTIIGYDATHTTLTKAPELEDQTTSLELKGSDIVNLIKQEAPQFQTTPKPPKEYKTKITKDSSSTYGAILQDQAKGIGYEFFPSRNVFNYKNIRENTSVDHTFQWGKNIIQFVPSINTSNLFTAVEVRTMPPDGKEKIIGGASTGKETKLENGTTASQLAEQMYTKKVKEINTENYDDVDQATTKALSELNRLGDNLITGSLDIVGNPNIELGQVVFLEKLGKKFSGHYLVTKITHNFSDSGYITSLELRKNVIRSSEAVVNEVIAV